MHNTTESCQERWGGRIRRARELQAKHSAIANALRFYEAGLGFQAETACQPTKVFDPASPLREQIDMAAVLSTMPSILAISAERGPDRLREEARHLQKAGEERWHRLVEVALQAAASMPAASDDFFARVCLQPVAENLQLQMPKDPNYKQNVCPACGGLPQLAILRPQGEARKRSLLCSFCLYEWAYRETVCPWCGEEDKQRLPHYRSEEWTYVHVEACDNCQRYLKVVDMKIDGSAVPLVDEAALAVLDVWASGLGYTKVVRNMIGF